MKAIRNIIFDFGNVIVDLDRKAVEQKFAALGIDVKHFLGLSAQKGVFLDLELGRIEPKDWYDQVIALAPQFQIPGQPLRLSPESIKEAWNSMLAGIPHHRLEAIKRLKEKYHIALLSNTNKLHVEYSFEQHFRAQGYEPTELFEHLFLSYEMGLAKPGKDIFEETLRVSGFKPEETIFIDDSAENCAAFARLGVQTFCPQWPDEWLQHLCPAVGTIGFFDGVHKGHRFLIDKMTDTVMQLANKEPQTAWRSLAVTFAEHPRSVLQTDYIPQLLTSPTEKVALLKETGIDSIAMLHFTRQMSQLSAKDFMQQILRDKLGVKVLIMGYDHHFGHDGGSLEQYQTWGNELGIQVIKAEARPEETRPEEARPEEATSKGHIENISSSAIRKLLVEGKVDQAAELLGHPYTLKGNVVSGHHVGHELGFPTANLQQDCHKLVPCNGVYAVWAEIENGERYAGMLNIGQRPTIDNGSATTIEVNLLDFQGDLYGRNVTLHFIAYLRPEHRFENREALIQQITIDRDNTRKVLIG